MYAQAGNERAWLNIIGDVAISPPAGRGCILPRRCWTLRLSWPTWCAYERRLSWGADIVRAVSQNGFVVLSRVNTTEEQPVLPIVSSCRFHSPPHAEAVDGEGRRGTLDDPGRFSGGK